MSDGARTWIDRNHVLAFVLLSYALTWTAYGLWSQIPDSQALLSAVVFVSGAFGPVVAGLVLAWTRGMGARRWIRTVAGIRIPARYYLLALAVPIAVVALAGGVHWLVLGGELTPEEVPEFYEYPLFLTFVVLFGGGLEEPGWRGYLLPALQSRFDALTAALAVGVVWATWHLPLFVLEGTIQTAIPPWLYAVEVVAISVVLTWLTNVSASVLPAVILHGGANAVVNYYPVGGATGGTSTTGFGLLTATVVVAAVVVVALYGRRLRPAGVADPAWFAEIGSR